MMVLASRVQALVCFIGLLGDERRNNFEGDEDDGVGDEMQDEDIEFSEFVRDDGGRGAGSRMFMIVLR